MRRVSKANSASTPAYTSSDQQKIASLKNQITTLKNDYQNSHPDCQKEFAAWQNALLALPRTKWEALELYQLGDSGQKYLPQPDRSIINMGYAASRSTEQFTSESKIPTVRSVRLELLNDPYLPLDGPGRSTNGTGALSDFKLLAGPTSDQLQPLALSDPYASLNPSERLLDSDRFPKDPQHSPENRRTGSVELLLDDNSDTGWTNELHPDLAPHLSKMAGLSRFTHHRPRLRQPRLAGLFWHRIARDLRRLRTASGAPVPPRIA